MGLGLGQVARHAVPVCKNGDGMVCTVLNEQAVPSPEEVVGDPRKFIGCEVDGGRVPRALRYRTGGVHWDPGMGEDGGSARPVPGWAVQVVRVRRV